MSTVYMLACLFMQFIHVLVTTLYIGRLNTPLVNPGIGLM